MKDVVAILSSALAVVALADCAKVAAPDADGGRLGACETRAQCDLGQVCTPEGVCANCSTSGQCSVKETCDAETRLCVLRAGWGNDCVYNEDCQAGGWCKQGLCAPRTAVTLCANGEGCPQAERCNPLTKVCEEDLGCFSQDDCGQALVCNTGSHLCVPRCTQETQREVCGPLERCVESRCVECQERADCSAGLSCDAAGHCSAADRCYGDRDCAIPLVCLVETGACLPKRPPCISNDTCPADSRCEVASGRCVPKDCRSDALEPNDDVGRAFAVAPGVYRKMTLCENDVDWFSIDLARGDQLGINLDVDAYSERSFSTLIRDPGGRTVAFGHALVSYVAPVPQKYFVAISSSQPLQTYDVTFLKSRGLPCDDDAQEPNDTAAQPTPLNVTRVVEGMVCPQDEDWFRIEVPPGSGLEVALLHVGSSKGLLRLCLLSGDGTSLIQCSSLAQPTVSASVAQAEGQALLVRVSGDSNRVANSYTLEVQLR